MQPLPREPVGIDADRISAWLAANIPGTALPVSFERVAGGRSNLTFVVTDAAGVRRVLRRPPTGPLLPRAHDVVREHRIISALGPAGVPVPRALGVCEDVEVNGAPFFLMELVEGVIARTEADARARLSPPARQRAGMALVATLARIHSVDPDAAGLGDLGRREGYVARQLGRWHDNYLAANRARGATPLPDVGHMHRVLSHAVPEQGPATVVHGDYRLDNCVLSTDGSRVLAVLDWELCTLGDPLADLGQLMVYWPERGERSPLGDSPTLAPGFPGRAEMASRYAELTGRDVGDLSFYVSFAYWKLACILEGVYARYLAGAMGDDGSDPASYPETIEWLAAESRAAVGGGRAAPVRAAPVRGRAGTGGDGRGGR